MAEHYWMHRDREDQAADPDLQITEATWRNKSREEQEQYRRTLKELLQRTDLPPEMQRRAALRLQVIETLLGVSQGLE